VVHGYRAGSTSRYAIHTAKDKGVAINPTLWPLIVAWYLLCGFGIGAFAELEGITLVSMIFFWPMLLPLMLVIALLVGGLRD